MKINPAIYGNVEAILLDQDDHPLSTVRATLRLQEGHCVVQPLDYEELNQLLKKCKKMRTSNGEIWLLADGVISGDQRLIDFSMKRQK